MDASQEDDRQPRDETCDDRSADAKYRKYVREAIQRGLEDVAAGRVISHEEMKRRVQQWFKK